MSCHVLSCPTVLRSRVVEIINTYTYSGIGMPSRHIDIYLNLIAFMYARLSYTLCLCKSIVMSVYLSVYLSVCLPACLSVCLSICLSICLSVYLYAFLSTHSILRCSHYLYFQICPPSFPLSYIPVFSNWEAKEAPRFVSSGQNGAQYNSRNRQQQVGEKVRPLHYVASHNGHCVTPEMYNVLCEVFLDWILNSIGKSRFRIES